MTHLGLQGAQQHRVIVLKCQTFPGGGPKNGLSELRLWSIDGTVRMSYLKVLSYAAVNYRWEMEIYGNDEQNTTNWTSTNNRTPAHNNIDIQEDIDTQHIMVSENRRWVKNMWYAANMWFVSNMWYVSQICGTWQHLTQHFRIKTRCNNGHRWKVPHQIERAHRQQKHHTTVYVIQCVWRTWQKSPVRSNIWYAEGEHLL